MFFLFEFFEELDEMVYVSDPNTYEMIYMNRKLRDSLSYASHQDYRGAKCHQILQGCEQPCSFCTNSSLELGKFISWTHKNPVMNKRFLIKDSVFAYNDRLYRIEIAIDIDSEVVCQTPYYYARSESILNECLQQIISLAGPEESLESILAYIGKTFLCDRVYVFEINGNFADNTYEWCREGVTPQKDILQNLPLSGIDWWIDLFQENKIITIQNLEEIRTKYPTAYAILKPQDISTLAAGPIIIDGKVLGFVGVDNPSSDMLTLISPLMKVIGYFVVSLLRRRDLPKRLNTLSFHDQLTGAYNRNAMFEHGSELRHTNSVGIIYCDITGLKQTNDTLGHSAGDQLICHCYNLIRGALDTPWIYRTGGDEFVSVFRDIDQQTFLNTVKTLQDLIRQDKFHIAVGYTWSDQHPLNLEALISQADKVMYQDKRDFYTANLRKPGSAGRGSEQEASQGLVRRDSLFYHFLSTTYHDAELLFQSMSQQNTTCYFYFGDMQKDLFYVSDNLREEFGFQSNVVPGLLQAWAQRIASAKFRDMYWQELNSMIQEKRSIHDLRYQVRDVYGRSMWVRCYGILKWNEDKSVPLFFSGRVTHQDDGFVVDPVTNFPRESVMLSRLDEIRSSRQSALAIGFSFNNIAEINSTRGRAFSDHLVQNITEDLTDKLSDKMTFFRLDGMRCAALVDPACKDSREDLVHEIKDIVSIWYHIMGITVQYPCSFALMEYPQRDLMPADFLEQIVSLIRVAKHDTSQMFAEYSEANIEKVKYMSNMALALSHDVLQGMEHFRVVVQPVVSTQNGEILGGELLLRWKFDGKDISPAVFVPMLENERMIQMAGRWIFEQAVCTCMRLVAHHPDFYLTFNVSLYQMEDRTFTDFMEDTLSKYQLSGSHLVAEMTESCMDEQPEKLIHFVDMCNKMGIRIALDDFGSGYSSLKMLLQYPSNIIKLDRSLLGEMTQSEDKMNFISSIVYACHRFGKKVCMEGVETSEQDTLIKESGCDMIQGYYYYRPMEIEDIYALLAANSKKEPGSGGFSSSAAGTREPSGSAG